MWTSPLRSSIALLGGLVASASALPQNSNGNGGSSSGGSGGSACNNSPKLCSRKFSEVTYLGAHNSYALRDESTNDSISGNQYFNATVALDAGLRLLQVQTHEGPNGGIQLCHSSCELLDAGPLQNWLSNINNWMEDNPNDVVTIIIVNGGRATASEFQSAYESAGIADKMYAPQSSGTGEGSEWPTLQKMIDDNTRLVTFSTNTENDSNAPGILPEFDHVFETHFDVSDLTGFNCTVDRPTRFSDSMAGGTTALSEGYLSMVNHFAYSGIGDFSVPDVENIKTVNSAGTSQDGNLGKHLQECRDDWSKRPNFVLIDFWSEEDPLAAVDSMNQVSSAEGREDPPAETASNSGGRNSGNMAAGALVAAISGLMLLV